MTVPVRIDDPADPRIAPYTAIKERDLTGRGDRFIIEGKVALEVLVTRGQFALESVFVADHRLPAASESLARLDPGVPVYTANRAVFDAIAGFPVHRGILACGRKRAAEDLSGVLAERRLVAGFGLSNHDNVGALFRNAAAFGAGGVVLDAESCDPLYRKSIRVSGGAALWLPFHHGNTAEDLMEALEGGGHTIWALTPRADAPSIWEISVPERLTVLVGAEGPGLPNAIIERAQPVRIPMAPGVDSVNVATAAAIALAHLFKDLPGGASD